MQKSINRSIIRCFPVNGGSRIHLNEDFLEQFYDRMPLLTTTVKSSGFYLKR